jgi:hypothetical protein
MSFGDRIAQLEKVLSQQVEEAEHELRSLQSSSSAGQYGLTARSTGSLSSHGDQVLSLMRQGQEGEAIFALIHVVQRLLDEKAPKRSPAEKTNVSYVDSLCQRVASGVQDNLQQCTSESLCRLRNQVADVQQKIANLRRFVQVELHDIEMQLADLKRVKVNPGEENETKPAERLDAFSYTIARADGHL